MNRFEVTHPLKATDHTVLLVYGMSLDMNIFTFRLPGQCEPSHSWLKTTSSAWSIASRLSCVRPRSSVRLMLGFCQPRSVGCSTLWPGAPSTSGSRLKRNGVINGVRLERQKKDKVCAREYGHLNSYSDFSRPDSSLTRSSAITLCRGWQPLWLTLSLWRWWMTATGPSLPCVWMCDGDHCQRKWSLRSERCTPQLQCQSKRKYVK